jgi:hypothetical protein|tara:strand:- start:418 stop:555 length:138 start_codon:yes stop_codon:yes gene_type:complete
MEFLKIPGVWISMCLMILFLSIASTVVMEEKTKQLEIELKLKNCE